MIFNREEHEAELNRWENRLVKTCVVCNGTGSVERGKEELAIMCNCKKRSLLNAKLVSSGIPRKFLDSSWDWEGFNNSQDCLNKVKEYAINFKKNYYAGRGLYIYGQQGRGKSMLEALAARDIALQINPDNNRQYKVAFIIFEELVQMSHDSRNNIKIREKMNKIISSPDLLIIDNLGSETGQKNESGHVPRFLEFILRKRNNDCVPTIVSSNYTPEQLRTEYTDTIHQFIEENFDLVLVQGDNWRAKRGTPAVSDELDELLDNEELLNDNEGV